MLKRPVIEKDYVTSICGILYEGERNDRNYQFHLLDPIEIATLQSNEFEVVGWMERTADCPYDFILFDSKKEEYFVSTLKGRSDGWPLFAIQDGKPTCSRTRMGSSWNCRLCAKYFGEVCKGR